MFFKVCFIINNTGYLTLLILYFTILLYHFSMNKQNLNDLEKVIADKYKKKEKRKKARMKVSGAGVKNLQKIIRNCRRMPDLS